MKTYLPHQQRVLDEHRDLAEKLQKLVEFVKLSAKFDELDPIDQKLLEDQYEPMYDYLSILERRIARF